MPFDVLAWMDSTNRIHRPLRRSCLELIHRLNGFFDSAELGTAGFVARYLAEITQHGYRQAPLEQMAYGLEQRYRDTPQRPFKVMEAVKNTCKNEGGSRNAKTFTATPKVKVEYSIPFNKRKRI